MFAGAVVSPLSEYSHAPRIKEKNGYSTNWAGYAVTGSAGSVTDAKGSWIVPNVTCPSTTNQYSSFWVGIDGYSSSKVEQTGTDSDCSSGSPRYYAWYEFYPKPSFIINSMTVHPGDKMSAEVKYAGDMFTVYITDVTTRASFSKSAKVNSAQRDSAEWIAEAPWSGSILPLANFGTVGFGIDNTGIASTNYTTVSGIPGNMNSFGSSANPITMVSNSGAIKVHPSTLSTDGTSFNVTWASAGP